MSTSTTETRREFRFALGTFTGVLILAFGVGFYWLATSRGVRKETGGFIPEFLSGSIPVVGFPVLAIVAIAVMGLGLAGRIYRTRFPENVQNYVKTVSTFVLVIGFTLFSLFFGAETNQDAPFLSEGPVPITLVTFLIAGAVFTLGQLSRLKRAHRLFSKRQKTAITLVALVAMLASLVPGVVFMLSVYNGQPPAEASQVISLGTITFGGGMHKMLMFAIAFELFFIGYAVLRTAAREVGF